MEGNFETYCDIIELGGYPGDLLSEYRRFVWEDEHILEVDDRDGCRKL